VSQTPPAPLPRTVLWSLLVLVAILIAWATFGQLDIVATAEGKLIPRSFLKIVQPAENGIMKELLVREGELVRAGQVLMRMDTRLSDADTRALQAELALRRLQLRRIDAEFNDRPFLPQIDDPLEIFAKALDQYRANRQAYLDSLGQERAALSRAQHELNGADETLRKLRYTLPYYQKQKDTFDQLGREGFASALLVEDKRREFNEKDQDLKAQRFAVESLEAATEQSEKKIAQITSAYRQQLQTERLQAASQVEKLAAEWDKQVHRNGLLELKAQQAGIVKDIASHTAGTVVSPGTILLTLVPLDEPLIAEVQVKNQDSGFIYATQAAKVKVVSYPFQKYGMVEGEVTHFSADASDTVGARPEELNPESRLAVSSYYKAHIRLKEQALRARGETLKLLPGMQVVAEIHLGHRSVMEYLLSPVQKAVNEAGREH
jgi:hemolysin D